MANPIWQGSTGARGNDWTLGSNWSTGTVPQPGDNASIPSGTPVAVLSGGAANVQSVSVANGASVTFRESTVSITGNFVDDGGVGIDSGFLTDAGGSTVTIGGTLTVTNAGAGFSIGNRAQTVATTVSASSVTNTGGINIAGNPGSVSVPSALAALDVASVAGFGGTAGVLTGDINLGIGVGGAGGAGDALLDFEGGGLINTIQGGTVQLTGANAFIASGSATSSNSALAGPLTIDVGGGLGLQAGAAVSTQDLTVAGSVTVDTAFLGNGGSNLTVNGVLAVTGNFSIGRECDGNRWGNGLGHRQPGQFRHDQPRRRRAARLPRSPRRRRRRRLRRHRRVERQCEPRRVLDARFRQRPDYVDR